MLTGGDPRDRLIYPTNAPHAATDPMSVQSVVPEAP
jgi:hypothetical protein